MNLQPSEMSLLTKQSCQVIEQILKTTKFFTTNERDRIMIRLAQIHRRTRDPRIFIAFIGEKKAGKTALVRALTGVPLPMAVRECTAAICEIQVGLDWHHQAQMTDGNIEAFLPVDETVNQIRLREAAKEEVKATNASVKKLEDLNKMVEEASKEELQAQEELNDAKSLVVVREKDLNETKGSFFNIIEFFSWLSWLISWIKTRLEAVATAEKMLSEAHLDLGKKTEHFKLKQKQAEDARNTLPVEYKKSQDVVSEKKQHKESEQQQLEAVKKQNAQQFQNELQRYVDLTGTPAEKVTIHTPNSNIPFNIVLLDTPGFNTDKEVHRQLAWRAIEEMADLCILVSDLRQPMPNTALQMLERMEPFCPHLHVALTKSDLAYKEADDLGGDPEEEIREAEQTARSRISDRWEHKMTIWTVASVEEDDQIRTRKLFESFWNDLPKDAREQKSLMLVKQAVHELMEICSFHMRKMEDQITKFNSVALDLAFSLVSDLEKKDSERIELTAQCITHTLELFSLHLEEQTKEWKDQLAQCETKLQLRRCWDNIKNAIQPTFKQLNHQSTQDLGATLNKASLALATSKENEFAQTLKNDLNIKPSKITPDTSQTKVGWAWAAGGMVAGGTMGIALSGGIALPLLLAAGAGGLANLLLAPLAEAKEQLITRLDNALQAEKDLFEKQLNGQKSTFEEKVLRSAEKELKAELEKKEQQNRAKLQAKLKKIQQVWNKLFEQHQKVSH
ncbi:MAG: hypothetical protein CMK59_08755 [Proteobacteria bacterium]|nr:hypothetical protein [Pseudomonadota bacterium]